MGFKIHGDLPQRTEVLGSTPAEAEGPSWTAVEAAAQEWFGEASAPHLRSRLAHRLHWPLTQHPLADPITELERGVFKANGSF